MIAFMFKLLLIPLFVVIAVGVVKASKFLFRLADSFEVDETKDDIDHKADLVDDVESYKLHNMGKMNKASSNSVKEFNNS